MHPDPQGYINRNFTELPKPKHGGTLPELSEKALFVTAESCFPVIWKKVYSSTQITASETNLGFKRKGVFIKFIRKAMQTMIFKFKFVLLC